MNYFSVFVVHFIITIFIRNNISIKKFSFGSETFKNCSNLKTVKLSGWEDSIGSHAFEDCKNLEKVENGKWVAEVREFSFINCENLENIDFPNLKYIWLRAFENCVSLKTFNFVKVKKIRMYAFNNCFSISEIYLPLSVEMIVSKAFTNCPSLIINTAHVTKPELWYDGFKDNQTIINYNVTKKEK